MITIVVHFQFFDGSFSCGAQRFCQFINVVRHLGEQLLLGDSTYSRIFPVHRNIGDIIQFAEDAKLRKLGDTGEEDKAEIRVAILQWTIEITHDIAKILEIVILVCYIKKRSIVFINEHDHLLSRSSVHIHNQACQSHIRINSIIFYTKLLFIQADDIEQVSFQLLLLHVFAHSHTEMEHRIFCPILLQLFNGKSLKEFFLSFEITL